MKKTIVILAAAALALGMTACTAEVIEPEIIDGGTEIINSPRVKTAEDLAGTQWTYSMDDMVFEDMFTGETMTIPADESVFTLTFTDEYAQIAFPDDMMMLSMDENFDLQMLEAMHFSYTYDMATTTGTLTTMDNDVMGQPIDMSFNFTYDEANDDIIIDLGVFVDEATGFQLVFNRNE